MSEKLITLKTFPFPNQAYIIKGKLESEGIFCFLKNELTAQVTGLNFSSVGGIDLQVMEKDLEKATEILNSSEILNNNSENNNFDRKENEIICPFCNSNEVSKQKKAGWWFFIFAITIGLFLPILNTEYHCFNCGKDFKLDEEGNLKT